MTFQSVYKGVTIEKLQSPRIKRWLIFYFRRDAKNVRNNLVDSLCYGFGGIMDAIGALARISHTLLKLAHTTFGLFASTVGSCLVKHYCLISI
jgi:NhaC family Na+:H+ antiporter